VVSCRACVFKRANLFFQTLQTVYRLKSTLKRVFCIFQLDGFWYHTFHKIQVAFRFSSFFCFCVFILEDSTPGGLNSGSKPYNLGSFSPKRECVRLRSEQQPGKLMPNIYAKGYEQNACEAARLDRQTRGSALY
jgi:hypothetical protein